MSRTRARALPLASLAAWLALAGPLVAQELAELRQQLVEAGQESSATRMRRSYKRVVRVARGLLEDAADSPERWTLLALVFEGQKQLLVLEQDADARADLLATCAELAQAPDAHAELRLEADLLLSEQALSAANADVQERALALEELIARYRDTPGEAKSLMMASQIAPKLEAFDLEVEILRTMQERFADHHEVIEYRRESLAAGRIEALFRGSFVRTDGTTLTFPIDRLGHQSLLVFWSGSTPGYEAALRAIDAHRQAHPGRFDFYSLNLDELPDAGEATLRELELPWEVLLLPGGRSSQTYRTYGRREPVGVLVNAYGYTLLTPTHDYGSGHGAPADPHAIDPVRLTDARYLAQLQALFVGDYLVATTAVDETHPLSAALRAIHECFAPAPHRYRLGREEALANYEEAERRCLHALEEHAGHPELWRVRCCRILALLGRWKLADALAPLRTAVEESRALLAADPAASAALVARYCLAKDALRSSPREAESLLSDFVAALGAEDAPAAVIAAAALLALDASSRPLHQLYRQRLLDEAPDDPLVWDVLSFLRDRYHTLDLLKVKLNRPERRVRDRYGDHVGPRGHAINHGLEPMNARLPDLELLDLDGAPLRLPAQAEGALTLLLFLEPPADPEADFPVLLDRDGQPTANDPLRTVMGYALERAALHVHDEVQVIAAFLSDDAERVRGLMQSNAWDCRAALVPQGLDNPLVRRLGILSADRIPNVFLLRRDGSVAWHTSGFSYKSDFGYPFAIYLALKVHIEVCDIELAYAALARGEYERARHLFSGPFELERDERYGWRSPRFHGRALASGGLGDWEGALQDIETAIAAHDADYDHGEEDLCANLSLLRRERARILDALGRVAEAASERATAARGSEEPSTSRYGEFHQRLEQLSTSEGGPAEESAPHATSETP